MREERDQLGCRMKTNYEAPAKTFLQKKTPVVIRIDGKAFHTFTRGFQKPFDGILRETMDATMKYLCENIQGCVLGYTQSDEISILLIDYMNENSSMWFDGQVQKIVSVSASMATMAFNREFARQIAIRKESDEWTRMDEKYRAVLEKAMATCALFDARCFNIPKEEAANYFYWRQADAMRNSVAMVGFANFKPKEMHGKAVEEVKAMLQKKGIDWEQFPAEDRHGTCCIKTTEMRPTPLGETVERNVWIVDKDIPVFLRENREYIEKWM